MGVLPLQFKDGDSVQSLKHRRHRDVRHRTASKAATSSRMQDVTLVITRKDGATQRVPLTLRIDTPIEVDYSSTAGSCRTCCARFWPKRRKCRSSSPTRGGSAFS